MMALVQAGKMRPLVSKAYAMAEWREAFSDMMSRAVIGKVVLRVGDAGAEPAAARL